MRKRKRRRPTWAQYVLDRTEPHRRSAQAGLMPLGVKLGEKGLWP